MSQKAIVQDVIQPCILECPPSEILRNATRQMFEQGSSAILIVENDQPVGIWTERDVLNFDFLVSDASMMPISKVMRSPVETIPATTTLDDVTVSFTKNKLLNYLVVSEDGARLGILTQTDIVLSHDLSHFLNMRRIAEIVTSSPVTHLNASLMEAAHQMRKFNTDAIAVLPSLDLASGPMGILSQRDLVRALATKKGNCPVHEIATAFIVTVRQDETIFNARNTMIKNGFRHLGVVDPSGHFIGIVSFSDILKCMQEIYFEGLKAAWDQHSEVLHLSRKRLALAEKIVEFSMDGILVTDKDATILSVNPALTQMMGYAPEEMIGKSPAMLSSDRHDQVFYAVMWRKLKSSGHWQGEIWNRDKQGNIRPQLLTISQIPDEEGGSYCYAAIYRDISVLKESETEVRKLAFYDSLTGLPNRRAIENRLERKLAAAERRGRYGALLYIDLDNFKPINDSLGHAIGDLLLIEVADRLTKILREEDMAARHGGDEFIVLLPELGSEMQTAAGYAQTVAEKVERALRLPYDVAGHRLTLGASIGITMFPEKQGRHQDVLQQADMAMYSAKESRRKIHFYDQAQQASVSGQIGVEKDLKHALEKGALCLYHAPQVDAEGKMIGVEAILSWNHPEKGVIVPHYGMTGTQKNQSVLHIELWKLREACGQIKSWTDAGIPFHQLSLDISPNFFLQSDFAYQVEQNILETHADPHSLVFQLTEHMVFNNFEESIHKMKMLKAYGIRFALDDFGRGRSSLSALKMLPLAQIKISDQYLSNLETDPHNSVIIQTIIAIAQAMKFDVIAEGIETEAQLESLRAMGCQAFQGPFIGEAVPAPEMPVLISELLRRLNSHRSSS